MAMNPSPEFQVLSAECLGKQLDIPDHLHAVRQRIGNGGFAQGHARADRKQIGIAKHSSLSLPVNSGTPGSSA